MLVIKQLGSLIKNNKSFMIMLVVIQVVTMFSILFITGVIINSGYIANSSSETKSIEIRFKSEINYDQIEKDMLQLSRDIPGRAFNMYLLHDQIIDVTSDTHTDIWGYTRISNRRYEECTQNRKIKYEIVDGRYFSEKELKSNNQVAIAYRYPKECNSITINGMEYSFVGKVANIPFSGYTVVDVPVTSFRNISVKCIIIETDIILDDNTCDSIRKVFDKNFAGQYVFNRTERYMPDIKSLYKTIGMVSSFLLLIVVAIMIRIYTYILKDNVYTMGVWKLLGSSHINMAINFTLQMVCVTLPSLFAGYFTFCLIKNIWFVRLYPYMNIYCTEKVCLEIMITVFMVIMISYFICSLVNTRGKIRRLIR